jgi:hypothetical protein
MVLGFLKGAQRCDIQALVYMSLPAAWLQLGLKLSMASHHIIQSFPGDWITHMYKVQEINIWLEVIYFSWFFI